jgi:hypothetical protein
VPTHAVRSDSQNNIQSGSNKLESESKCQCQLTIYKDAEFCFDKIKNGDVSYVCRHIFVYVKLSNSRLSEMLSL